MPKKQVSTANIALITPIILGSFTYFYLTIDNLFKHPIIFGPLLFFIVLGIIFFIKIKHPLYIRTEDEAIKAPDYDNKYVRDISWWRCVYYCFFGPEPSKFVSFFSGTTLTLYTKGRMCQFILKNKPAKLKHRILDVFLSVTLSAFIFCAGIAFADRSWGFCTVLFLSCAFYFARKYIINYSLSVNIGDLNNHKVNVVYPYKSTNTQVFKYYGMVSIFHKTILITDKTFESNPIIKEYVLTHELGHLQNRKISILQYIGVIVFMCGLIFVPEMFSYFGTNNDAFPLLLFLIFFVYKYTIAKYLYLKSELLADEYAIKIIGKRKVLDALQLMKSFCGNNNYNQLSYSLFSIRVPLERRIRFVNEYIES